jgi:hypothetical protein
LLAKNMGRSAHIRQSVSTRTKFVISSRGVEDACTVTIEPSLRTTLSAGAMRAVEAVPTNMMTMNAMYVDVLTALRPPERMLIARAITAPMKDPSWKMAQNTPNALPLSFSSG